MLLQHEYHDPMKQRFVVRRISEVTGSPMSPLSNPAILKYLTPKSRQHTPLELRICMGAADCLSSDDKSVRLPAYPISASLT